MPTEDSHRNNALLSKLSLWSRRFSNENNSNDGHFLLPCNNRQLSALLGSKFLGFRNNHIPQIRPIAVNHSNLITEIRASAPQCVISIHRESLCLTLNLPHHRSCGKEKADCLSQTTLFRLGDLNLAFDV